MTDCNVVRDLMPLAIDGVASEESAKIVEKHVAECESCAQVYAELQSSLPSANTAKENEDFIKAARIMRTWRLAKRIMAALLILTLVTGAAYTGWYFWDRNDRAQRARLDVPGMNLWLVRDSEGRIHFFFDGTLIEKHEESYTASIYVASFPVDWTTAEGEFSTSILVNDFRASQPVTWHPIGYWINGSVIYDIDFPDEPVLQKVSLRLKKGEPDLVIYVQGQDIPLCSKELEAYLDVYGEDAEIVQAAYERVPEFQTR